MVKSKSELPISPSETPYIFQNKLSITNSSFFQSKMKKIASP